MMAHHAEPIDDEPEMVDSDSDHSETSEETSSDDGDEEIDVKKRFDKILSELKSGHLNLTIPQQREFFLAHNSNVLSKRTSDEHQNLLHILAQRDKESLPSWERLEPLVRILVQLPDNLLAWQDGDNKTPLYIAATRAKRKSKLLRAMCEEYSNVHGESRSNIQGTAHRNEGDARSDAEREAHGKIEGEAQRNIESEVHGNMDSVLSIQFNMETCLHVVIRKMVPQEHVLDLIKRAGPKTLCAQDNKGNTPLHVAVDYNLCLDGQIRVVEALVNQCDAAMDVVNSKGMSPYRYHEETRQEAVNRAKAQEAKTQRNQHDIQGRTRALPPGQEPPPQLRRPLGTNSLPHGTNTLTEQPPGKYGVGSTRGKTSVTTSPSTSLGVPAQVPAANPLETKPSKKATKTKEEIKPSPDSANAIKSFLKLYFLRERKHDAAIDFLYSSSREEYQIYFDLVGCSPVIKQREIRKNLYLQFEDVLQYVAVPQVRIEPESKSQPAPQGEDHNRLREPDGKGRTDLVLLFKWLRNEKGVKTILKVIVEDLQEPAHSDEAIEDALEGAGVEDWDWRKTDLCSEVIYKVAPKARIVHLYWSGNNPTLRGWSEAEGLAKLKDLEKVILNSRQGLETSKRTKLYMREFKERMKKHHPNPNLQISLCSPRASSAKGSAAQEASLREEQEIRHRWLITMDNFTSLLGRLEPPKLEEPITVALIDDGIDIDDPILRPSIVAGRSFCSRDVEQNLNEPYYVSSGGHGTAMASLICRVCPNVNLYVLKLDEYRSELGKRQITAESAAKAVRAAVERGVHIISMSWSIEPTGNTEDLKDAIVLAAKEGILMFCAATDQGAYGDNTYPAASTTNELFKIGAAEASGTALKWLGDQRAVDFIFPGHNVIKERPGEVPPDKYTSLTGSSVATALAAGLAAVILYCVQVAALHLETQPARVKDHELTMDVFRALKKHDGMKMAFLEIGTTDESEKKYITVWERFKKPVKSEKNTDPERLIDLIVALAKELKPRHLNL